MKRSYTPFLSGVKTNVYVLKNTVFVSSKKGPINEVSEKSHVHLLYGYEMNAPSARSALRPNSWQRIPSELQKIIHRDLILGVEQPNLEVENLIFHQDNAPCPFQKMQ